MNIGQATVHKLVPSAVIPMAEIEAMFPVHDVDEGQLSSRLSEKASNTPMIWSEFGQSITVSAPLVVADTLTLVGSFGLAAAFGHLAFDVPGNFARLPLLASLVVVGGLAKAFFGCYPGLGTSPVVELRQLTLSGVLTFMMLLTLHASVGVLSPLEAFVTVLACAISLVLMPISRNITRKTMGRFAWWGVPIVIVGADRHGLTLYDFYRKSPKFGLRPVGIIDEPDVAWRNVDETDYTYLGGLKELERVTTAGRIFWAVAAISEKTPSQQLDILRRCQHIPNVFVLPNLPYVPSLWTRSQECGGLTGFYVRENLLLPLPRLAKRAADLFVGLTAALLALPAVLVIMALIKVLSPGPIFYGHERIGQKGRRFRAWKFRSMACDADEVLAQHLEDHPVAQAEWERDHKLRQDPRVIPGVGSFLRRTSLDELPQLWNVLRGEMSLVGPRPIVQAEIVKYRGLFPLYVKVRPGITGLWQISGRNNTTYEERVALDSYYARNWSPWLDLYILIQTVRTVLYREGAY